MPTDINSFTKKQYYKLSFENDASSTPKTSTPSSPKHPPSSPRHHSSPRQLPSSPRQFPTSPIHLPASPKQTTSSRQDSINRRLDQLITNNLNIPDNFHQDVIIPTEENAPPLPPRSYKFPASTPVSPTSPQLTNGILSQSCTTESLQNRTSNDILEDDPLGRENLSQVNRQIYESLGQMSPTSMSYLKTNIQSKIAS